MKTILWVKNNSANTLRNRCGHMMLLYLPLGTCGISWSTSSLRIRVEIQVYHLSCASCGRSLSSEIEIGTHCREKVRSYHNFEGYRGKFHRTLHTPSSWQLRVIYNQCFIDLFITWKLFLTPDISCNNTNHHKRSTLLYVLFLYIIRILYRIPYFKSEILVQKFILCLFIIPRQHLEILLIILTICPVGPF